MGPDTAQYASWILYACPSRLSRLSRLKTNNSQSRGGNGGRQGRQGHTHHHPAHEYLHTRVCTALGRYKCYVAIMNYVTVTAHRTDLATTVRRRRASWNVLRARSLPEAD